MVDGGNCWPKCNITRQSATYHYFFTKMSIYFSKVCKKYDKKTIAYFCELRNFKKLEKIHPSRLVSTLRNATNLITNNMNIEAFLVIHRQNKCTHHVPGEILHKNLLSRLSWQRFDCVETSPRSLPFF